MDNFNLGHHPEALQSGYQKDVSAIQPSSLGNVGASKHINLISVASGSGESVQSVEEPPDKVPANHLAVHVPSGPSNLRNLQPKQFERAQNVYVAARPDPAQSLYARGQYWFDRMKNWVTLRPNEARIEGVDQSFFGFTRDVVGEGWNFLYDQLKTVRAYGAGLFGFSADISRIRSADAQMDLYQSFKVQEKALSDLLESEFDFIDQELQRDLEAFNEATEKNDAKALEAFKERGMTSVDLITKHYHGEKIRVVDALTATLHQVAVSLNPDYVAERKKVEKLVGLVSALEAQLLIASTEQEKAKLHKDQLSTEIHYSGTERVSWKEFDGATAALKRAEDNCALIEKKLEPLKAELDKATKRLKNQERVLLEQEGRFSSSNLEADARLGHMLSKEATSSAMKTWTWSVNDFLKTLQYGCAGLGLLGIPVVSPVALGISFVTGSLSLAMYGEDTVYRGKEAAHAGSVRNILNRMAKDEHQDPELNAIRTLIDNNLSYKEKSVKTFFTSLGIVSTLATLSLATMNLLAFAGVVSATAMAIVNPLAWGIGGICLVAGLSFAAYSASKAIYFYYREYKTEQLLGEALEMRDNPSMKGSDAYNQLFMKTLEGVAAIAPSREDIEQVDGIVKNRMQEHCADVAKKMDALEALVRHGREAPESAKQLAKPEYERLFSGYSRVFAEDALTHVGFDAASGKPITPEQQRGVSAFISAKIQTYIDSERSRISDIQGDIESGTESSDAYKNLKSSLSRVVAGELEQGLMQERIKIANDRIIEQSLLKLMEQRPSYGIRVLIQRIREKDETAINFIKALNVFSDDELDIIMRASRASEPRVIEMMMKRLGFNT
jgi:hypothetical protein